MNFIKTPNSYTKNKKRYILIINNHILVKYDYFFINKNEGFIKTMNKRKFKDDKIKSIKMR